MLSVVTGESITFGQGGEQKGIKFRLGHGCQPDAGHMQKKEATYTCIVCVYDIRVVHVLLLHAHANSPRNQKLAFFFKPFNRTTDLKRDPIFYPDGYSINNY